MKLTKLIEIAMSAERIPFDVAEGILGYGITEFLSEGLSYTDAVDLIARAEISKSRRKNLDVSFPQH